MVCTVHIQPSIQILDAVLTTCTCISYSVPARKTHRNGDTSAHYSCCGHTNAKSRCILNALSSTNFFGRYNSSWGRFRLGLGTQTNCFFVAADGRFALFRSNIWFTCTVFNVDGLLSFSLTILLANTSWAETLETVYKHKFQHMSISNIILELKIDPIIYISSVWEIYMKEFVQSFLVDWN